MMITLTWLSSSVTGSSISAVLPSDPRRLFSISRVRPAADIALRTVRESHILDAEHAPYIRYKDSKCSEAAGMNEAINFYVEGGTNVFFGPVCDYAAAPVARQTGYWNVPMVSVGAMAMDFWKRRSKVYPLLTRAGPANLLSLASGMRALVRRYGWTKVKILYQRNGQGHIVNAFCHLISEALVYGKSSPRDHDITVDYYRLPANTTAEQIRKTLRNEVGDRYAGKSSGGGRAGHLSRPRFSIGGRGVF